MKCPIDGSNLSITDRSGIEIDFCPECRGVWLDRGELDKLIDRAAPAPVAAGRGLDDRSRDRDRDDRDDRYDRNDRYDRDDDYRYGKKRKKRESFLSEIFDFG